MIKNSISINYYKYWLIHIGNITPQYMYSTFFQFWINTNLKRWPCNFTWNFGAPVYACDKIVSNSDVVSGSPCCWISPSSWALCCSSHFCTALHTISATTIPRWFMQPFYLGPRRYGRPCCWASCAVFNCNRAKSIGIHNIHHTDSIFDMHIAFM